MNRRDNRGRKRGTPGAPGRNQRLVKRRAVRAGQAVNAAPPEDRPRGPGSRRTRGTHTGDGATGGRETPFFPSPPFRFPPKDGSEDGMQEKRNGSDRSETQEHQQAADPSGARIGVLARALGGGNR